MILKLFLELFHGRVAYKGSVIIMTLMLIVLLTIEVATISLVGIRSLSQEGVLRGQNISARRATEIAMQRLETTLYQDARSGTAMSALFDKYKLAGSVTTYSTATTLAVLNPETDATDTTSSNTQLSSWVQERRGSYFHLVGRAQTGGVDLLSHKWVFINPCFASGTGTLTTILATGGTNGPGVESTVATTTGRVYFGTSGGATQFYTWTPSTSVLSTLLPGGIDTPGQESTSVDSSERVYFGQNNSLSKLYTWSPTDRRLSTLLPSGVESPGVYSTISTTGGRVYFGGWSTPAAGMFTWDATSNRLSTLFSTQYPGVFATAVDSSGRVVVGEYSAPAGNVRYWNPSNNKLSTILPSTVVSPSGMTVANDGRIYFGNDDSPAKFWTYMPTTDILSTIVPAAVDYAGNFSNAVTASGRVYFGQYNNPGKMYTWDPYSRKLSTILPSAITHPGVYSMGIGLNDSLYFGQESASGYFYYYSPSTNVLSTLIPSAIAQPGTYATAVAGDGRVYFGQNNNPGNVYTWSPSTNILSTILPTAIAKPGAGTDWQYPGRLQSNSIGISSSGRVYFGQNVTPGNFYTWDPTTNVLSTLTPAGVNRPGYASTVAVDYPTTGVYFGTQGGGGQFFYWYQQSTCNTRGY